MSYSSFLSRSRTWIDLKFVKPLRSKLQTRSEVFARVYERKNWGSDPAQGDFFSGEGSLPAHTAEYEAYVSNFINENPDIRVVLDIGCGDFQVAKRFLDRCDTKVTYIGADVVESLVRRNSRLFSSPRVTFGKLDAVEDSWPHADLVLIREVLQHLSLKSVAKIVSKLSEAPYALVTDHCVYETLQPNLDLPDGAYARVALGSGTFLDRNPFNLHAEEVLNVRQADGLTSLRTILLYRKKP